MSEYRDKIIEYAEGLNFPSRLHLIVSLAKWLSEAECEEFCAIYSIGEEEDE